MWRMLFVVVALDLNSYCKGSCQVRYQDGAYFQGKCACIDYQSVNLGQRFSAPKRLKKEFDDPKVYDGVDHMHFAPSDPSPVLTAPMDF